MKLTRCLICDRVLILNTFVCADCAQTIERRTKLAILLIVGLIIIPAIATWLVLEALARHAP